MKRLAIAFCLLLLLPAVAHAFDPEPRSPRIGILLIPQGGLGGERLIEQIRRQLRDDGFDAYTVPATLEELHDGMGADADYYVELVTNRSVTPQGGIDVGGRNVGVSVEVVVSQIAGELRVYDESLQLIDSHELHERSARVMPTYLGLGDRNAHIGFALPFGRWIQDRRVVREAAREAAASIASTVRGE